MSRANYIQLEPRFTSGSAAGVRDRVLAKRVADEERVAFQRAQAGAYGVAEQTKANERGLALVVFEMRESGLGWEVRDWLTGELWFWPFKASCPTCSAKRLSCKRGSLTEHHWPRTIRDTALVDCSDRSFVGRKLDRW